MIRVTLIIDFLINKLRHNFSIIASSLTLKPTIRIVDNDNPSSISGKVFPQNAEPVVWTTTSSNDTVTAYPDSSGYFMLNAMPAGTSYNVVIHANNTTYIDTTVANVSVSENKDTDIGTITLTNKKGL